MQKPILRWVDRSKIGLESVGTFENGTEIDIYESEEPIYTFGRDVKFTLFMNSWERFSNTFYPAEQFYLDGKLCYKILFGEGSVPRDDVIMKNFWDQ